MFLSVTLGSYAADPCLTSLGEVTTTSTSTGNWSSDCESVNRSGKYARFYSFSVSATSHMRIAPRSSEDAYMFLLEGSGRTAGL